MASSWTHVGRGVVAGPRGINGRTRLTYPGGGLYVDYDHLVTGDMAAIRENGATSGVGVLATFVYDDLGNRTSLTRGNGTVTSYAYDPVSRLARLTHDLAGTSGDLSIGFNSELGSSTPIAYNPASQIVSAPRSNDAYSFTNHFAVTRPYASNGLNQYATVASNAFTYDGNGNLTSDGTSSFTYTSENMLKTAPGGTLAYDPLLRLQQLTASTTTRLAYDGLDRIAQYDGSDNALRRYVHGPATDEPLVWYEGSGTSDRRFLHADERGSVVAVTDGSGNLIAANTYDEYGIPGSANIGRFQ